MYLYIYRVYCNQQTQKEITNIYTTADGSPYYC